MALQPPTELQFSSTALWSSPTAPQYASRAPYIPCYTPKLSQAYSTSFPFSHLFTSAIPQPTIRLSSEEQHTHQFISPVPTYSLPTTPRRLSKAQIQSFMTSLFSSPATPPFQQHGSFGLQSTYPTSYTFQLCRGDQWLPRETPLLIAGDIPSPIMTDNTSDNLSPKHNNCSNSPHSPNLYQYLASLCQHPPLFFSPKQRCSSSPPISLCC